MSSKISQQREDLNREVLRQKYFFKKSFPAQTMKEDDIEILCGDIGDEDARTVTDRALRKTSSSASGTNTSSASVHVPPPAELLTNRSTISKVPVEIRNLIAGGLAGMVAKSVVAPIDRIKILFQVSSERFSLRHVPGVVRNICKHEGIPALWRGNSAMMLRVFPYSGIQFMVFDKCKSYMVHAKKGEGLPHQQHLSPFESLLAGSVAGVVSVFATYPLDLTRAQLAVHVKNKSDVGRRPTFINTLVSTYTRMGMVGLFQGITPTVLGILPYAGIAFTINEQGKRRIKHFFGRDETTVEKMIVGGVAGLVAQTITYPFEVTRRRMQTNGLVSANLAKELLGGSRSSSSSTATAAAAADTTATINARRTTMRDTIKYLYKEQGERGFFKGVSMNWIKGPVAFSISFTTYDLLKGWIQSQA